MKKTFTHTIEWSDWSEYSPTHRGQFPTAVILPDGERVELDDGARHAAYIDLAARNTRATYAQVHPNVRIRENHWGDDGSRRAGRAGSTLEILAPKRSRFIFARVCPWCGEKAGEAREDVLVRGRAEPLYHKSCKAEADEQERLIEEHCHYVAEQERLADEKWKAEYGHLMA